MGYFDYDQEQAQQGAETITVLQGLSEEEWSAVIEQSKPIHFEPGDLLLKAGESDDAVYIIVSGQVEVFGRNNLGINRRIALIDEGSVFGELAFFDRQPRSASIRGTRAGQVLRLSRKGFEQLAAWNPGLARQFLFDLGRILAYRFRNEIPYKI